MTREEAAKVLKLERASWSTNPNLKVAKCLCDAYDIAIKALEQEPKMGHWKLDTLKIRAFGTKTKLMITACIVIIAVIHGIIQQTRKEV